MSRSHAARWIRSRDALDAALHLGELELDRLDLGDRLAERVALLRVAHGLVERRAHHAERLGRDADAAGVEHAHRDLEALALGAQALFHRHPQVLERERDRVGAAQAHLVLGLADHEPGAPRSTMNARDARGCRPPCRCAAKIR